MKKLLSIWLVLALICACFSVNVTAIETENLDEEYGTGMIDTPETIAAFHEQCIPYSSAYNARTILPPSYDLSTSQYFPPIGNQGSQGSCVAWATGYYQFTFAKNKLLGITTTADNAASPAWIYNTRSLVIIDDKIVSGMYIGDAYSHLKMFGDVTKGQFGYNQYDSTSWVQNQEHMQEALNIRVSDYYVLTVSNSSVTSVNSMSLFQIKEALYLGNVLTASIILPDVMKTVYKYCDGKKIYYRGICGTDDNGNVDYSNHLVSIVGYDDSVWIDINGNGTAEAAEYGAFKIANSWGTNTSWGNGGYIWVSYDSLNAVSQVSGNWEENLNTVRRAMFSTDADGINYLYKITVQEMKPLFIGKISVTTNNAQNISISSTSTEVSTYGNFTRTQQRPYGDEFFSSVPFNGTFLIDLTPTVVYSADTSLTYIHTSTKITDVDLEDDTLYLESPLTNCTYSVIDSLGTELYEYSTTFTLNNHFRLISSSFDLSARGDVNYDQKMDSSDAQLVLRYVTGSVELSYLQMYYADYDMNGFVEAADALAILQAGV